ncbi:hypothetical protein N2K95_05930 [Arthrobacter zhaoxinii]|uniref:TPR-repeat-containing protein n=1 Tax=Arthrobacter zhaoxinii TaxID=2964616 RepID=A0ABY5YW35_9MICC|nr:hypothetical protein [Arthrobacter zhaoxinii]UWX98194.1 hypothetical protein N2K95_05930 [Arthrobacter zhaoxinii]
MSEQNNRDQRSSDGNDAARGSSSSDRRDDRGRPATNDRNAPKRFEDRKPSFGGRPARDGERKSFGDRGASSERKPYSKDRKPAFGDRPARSGDDRRPARDGERKPFSERSGERKPFGDRGDRKPSFGSDDRRPARDSDGRPPFSNRSERDDRASRGSDDRRPPRDGERKPFSERSGERKPFSRDSRPPRDGERKPFGDRGERKPFSRDDRPQRDSRPPRDGERKPFADRGDRKPSFGGDDRRSARDGERKPFSERSGERKPFSRDSRPARDGERKPFGDRGERKPFSRDDRPQRDSRPPRDGERKPFADRGPSAERKSFGDRGDRPQRDSRPPRDGERKSFGDRGDRKPFSRDDRPQRDSRPPRGDRPSYGSDRPSFSRDDAPAAARPRNAKDLRSANRPDRERSPEIDEDVTGQELDKVTRAQLRNLEEVNSEWVAKHLVMAGRLIDDEPELAFQHALAASRRGGRMAVVREAVGLTAYAAGHFGEALREFRTYRRISGSNAYLPMMADCERGLGHPEKALDMARSEDAKDLDTAGQVELAIVVSGARMDMEQFDAAVAALEIPQLDRNRAFSYSPRLFRAYADALDIAGRGEEAEKWRKQALRADEALGFGDFAEPEIFDLVPEEEERPKRHSEAREDRSGAYFAPAEEAPKDTLDPADDVDALPSDEQEGLLTEAGDVSDEDEAVEVIVSDFDADADDAEETPREDAEETEQQRIED